MRVFANRHHRKVAVLNLPTIHVILPGLIHRDTGTGVVRIAVAGLGGLLLGLGLLGLRDRNAG
ncbi:hypothetical protein SPB21_07790 [Leptothoe sp. ISB3NOV94-8A]